MLGYGYKKSPDISLGPKKLLFIDTQIYDKYLKLGLKNEEKINERFDVVRFKSIEADFRSDLMIAPLKISQYYNPFTDEAFIWMAQIDTILDLEDIADRSLFVNATNRPILILNFNPKRNELILPSSNYQLEKLKSRKYEYFIFEFPWKKLTIKAYILDHRIQAKIRLRFKD